MRDATSRDSFYGRVYKLALSDFEIFFEDKLKVEEVSVPRETFLSPGKRGNRRGLRDYWGTEGGYKTIEAISEEMHAFIMPCEEEEDEVNRQKESKRWQNVNP